MTLNIYSLKNCDTCKKALKWLGEHNISFDNRDVRADGLSKTEITSVVDTLGWEAVVNRRSTTWRGLDEADKSDLDNQKAVGLIAANPTLMKRPVFIKGDKMVVGFDAKAQTALEEII